MFLNFPPLKKSSERNKTCTRWGPNEASVAKYSQHSQVVLHHFWPVKTRCRNAFGSSDHRFLWLAASQLTCTGTSHGLQWTDTVPRLQDLAALGYILTRKNATRRFYRIFDHSAISFVSKVADLEANRIKRIDDSTNIWLLGLPTFKRKEFSQSLDTHLKCPWLLFATNTHLSFHLFSIESCTWSSGCTLRKQIRFARG